MIRKPSEQGFKNRLYTFPSGSALVTREAIVCVVGLMADCFPFSLIHYSFLVSRCVKLPKLTWCLWWMDPGVLVMKISIKSLTSCTALLRPEQDWCPMEPK